MADKMTVLGTDLDGDDNSTQGNEELDVAQFIESNVGEGKKYANLEEAVKGLAKSKVHADTFIETLKLEKQAVENEKLTLAEQLTKAKSLEDVLAALKDDGGGSTDHGGENLSKEQVLALIKEQTEAQRREETEKQTLARIKQNQEKAWDMLSKQEAFGSLLAAKKAVAEFIGDSKENAQIVNQMGGYNPEALVTLLKSHKPTAPRDQTRETKMTVTEGGTPTGKLTWSAAQKIKAENPRLYHSRSFQMAMHKAAAEDKNFLNT